MAIAIPVVPRHDEILLVVAFLAGDRPNAVSKERHEAVAKLVADMRTDA